MSDLTEQKCQACESGVPPLPVEKAKVMLQQLKDWRLSENNKNIRKEFTFKNFYQTMAFVNAIAWIANQEGHHPDVELGYNYCNVNFRTHAIDGLSNNDFICAAKIDALIAAS